MSIHKVLYSIVYVSLFIACNPERDRMRTFDIDSSSSSVDTSSLVLHGDTIHYPTPEEIETQAAKAIYERFFIPETILYVVSPLGSSLHVEPNENSEVVRVVPFRDSVTILEHPLSLEVIKRMRVEYGKTFWIKIRAQKSEGYLLSSEVVLSKIKNRKGSVHLFFTHAGCINNYAYRSDFKYYAVIKNDGQYILKKVQPEFFGLHEPWEELAWDYYDIGISGDEKAEPLFIFGLDKLLKEGTIKPVELLSLETDKEKKIVLQDRKKLHVAQSNNGIQLTFYTPVGNEIQVLNIFRLIWSGDLDGDDKIDFVYSKGNGELEGFAIALSSMANEQEEVKEVATFEIGLCC